MKEVIYKIDNMHEMTVIYDERYTARITKELLEDLIEIRTAKKPFVKTDKGCPLIEYYYCPSCRAFFGQRGIHNVILFKKSKYCEECGQRIDWSDKE